MRIRESVKEKRSCACIGRNMMRKWRNALINNGWKGKWENERSVEKIEACEVK